MANYAVLNNNNEVINIIVTDNKEQSEQDLGLTLVDASIGNGAVFGWVWNGENYYPPAIPETHIGDLAMLQMLSDNPESQQ